MGKINQSVVEDHQFGMHVRTPLIACGLCYPSPAGPVTVPPSDVNRSGGESWPDPETAAEISAALSEWTLTVDQFAAVSTGETCTVIRSQEREVRLEGSIEDRKRIITFMAVQLHRLLNPVRVPPAPAYKRDD